MTNAELTRFVALSYLLGFAAQALAIRAGAGSPAGRPFLLLTMWAPALAALLAGRSSRARVRAALCRTRWRTLGAALLVGWTSMALLQLFLAAAGAGRWNAAHFPLGADGSIAGVRGIGMVLGVGAQGWPLFAVNVLLSVSLGSLISSVMGGIGEELGWRSVLQRELEARWGPVRGTLAVAAIWAAWHLPANLAGYNDPVHPVWNALVLFPLSITGLAFGLAWLARRGPSVWPAAVAHGANNALAGGLFVLATGWAAEQAAALAASAVLTAVVLRWLPGTAATAAPVQAGGARAGEGSHLTPASTPR